MNHNRIDGKYGESSIEPVPMTPDTVIDAEGAEHAEVSDPNISASEGQALTRINITGRFVRDITGDALGAMESGLGAVASRLGSGE